MSLQSRWALDSKELAEYYSTHPMRTVTKEEIEENRRRTAEILRKREEEKRARLLGQDKK